MVQRTLPFIIITSNFTKYTVFPGIAFEMCTLSAITETAKTKRQERKCFFNIPHLSQAMEFGTKKADADIL
jgi:hypothetical protein